MTVIESATHSLNEAERQLNLGYKYGESELAYWAAYLDGARAQKHEDDLFWNKLIAESGNGGNE